MIMIAYHIKFVLLFFLNILIIYLRRYTSLPFSYFYFPFSLIHFITSQHFLYLLLDLQDRYLNNKATKYFLRSDQIQVHLFIYFSFFFVVSRFCCLWLFFSFFVSLFTFVNSCHTVSSHLFSAFISSNLF